MKGLGIASVDKIVRRVRAHTIDEEDFDLGERNIKKCKRKICDGNYTAAVRVLSSSGVAPYNDDTLEDLKTKHPFKPAPSLPYIPIDHQHLIASPAVVLNKIKSFPRGTSYGRDELCAQYLMDCLSGVVVAISDELVSFITQVVNLFLDGKFSNMLGEYIASAPLTPLVKPGGSICTIVVGTIWRRLVSKVSDVMIGHYLDGYLDDLQFGVGVLGSGEAILHVVNRLFEGREDDVGLSMLLVDFKNAFNLVLELIIDDGPSCGLHLNVDKIKVFWPKEDPRSRLAGVFPPNIARALHGVKLLGGPVSMDFDFSSELVMKRVAKTIELIDTVARINDPYTRDDVANVLLLMRATYVLLRLQLSPYADKAASDILDSFCGNPQIEDHTSDLLEGPSLISVRILAQLARTIGLFAGDIYGDHVVSCAGIIGIKHRHNVVCDTLVDICFRSAISAGKEVDIGLGGGCGKPLRPADMLLYSWDVGLDVCVDLTGSSLLTQTVMVDFVLGRAVIDTAHRKQVKYEAKCADIGYGFLPFSFSSLGELKKDAVTLLERI
ncbi:hypothetical protein Tco_1405189 [Tanacetum coccineum]